MLKIIAWNIAQKPVAWRMLVESNADIALLQEAKEPPADIAGKVNIDTAVWRTGAHRLWRATIVKLSMSSGLRQNHCRMRKGRS